MNDRPNKRTIDKITEGSEQRSDDTALAATSMPIPEQAAIANQTGPLNFEDLTFSNDELNSFLALPPIETQSETAAIAALIEDTVTNSELNVFSTKLNTLQRDFYKLTDDIFDPLYNPCIPFLRLRNRQTLTGTINLIEFLVVRRQSHLALDIWRNNPEVRAYFARGANLLQRVPNISQVANFFLDVLYPETKEISDYIWHAQPELGDFFKKKNDTWVFFKILGAEYIDLIKILLNNNLILKAKLCYELHNTDGTLKFMDLVRSSIHRDYPGFMQELIGAINDTGKLYSFGIEVLNTRKSLLTNSEQGEIYKLLETRRQTLISARRSATSQPQNTNQVNQRNATPASNQRSQPGNSSQGLAFNEPTFQNMIRNTTLLSPPAKQNTKKGRTSSNTPSSPKKG